MPNICMMRPGDGTETAGCYKAAVLNTKVHTHTSMRTRALASAAPSKGSAHEKHLGCAKLKACIPRLLFRGRTQRTGGGRPSWLCPGKTSPTWRAHPSMVWPRARTLCTAAMRSQMPSCLPLVRCPSKQVAVSSSVCICDVSSRMPVLSSTLEHPLPRVPPPCLLCVRDCHIGSRICAHTCSVHHAGSELAFAVEAAEKSSKKVRVVSMPCWELFEEQDESYKTSVLPPDVKARVSIEVRHLACSLTLILASGRALCCCG